MAPSLLRRIFLCPMGMCPHRPESDDSGCWGECIYCGHRAGFVDRATLRAFADAEYERERAKEASRKCTCHPNDNPPVPRAERYAFSECMNVCNGNGK